MKFEDLSPADQQLVNTDLGEFEKEASEQMAVADEMYAVGFEKLATKTADELDELYAMEKEASEKEQDNTMDEVSEKYAHDLSAFIERGFFDGLCKLGSERHGDEMYYLYPFIEEKIITKTAAGKLDKVRKYLASHVSAAKKKAKEVVKGEKTYRHGAVADIKSGAKGIKAAVTGKSGSKKVYGKHRWEAAKGGAKSMAKGVGKLTPYGLGAGGLAYAGKKGVDKMTSKKSEEQGND